MMELTQTQNELRRGANTSGILLILFYILAYGSSWLLSVLIKAYHGGTLDEMEDLHGFLTYTVQYPVIFPILVLVFGLLCGRHTGQRLRDVFCKPKVPKATMIRWVFICLGLTYASAYASRIFFLLIQAIFGIELTAQNFAADHSLLSMLTNIIAMMFYAPFFEEILFRGTIFRSMKKGGALAGAILCGLLFGLWHTNYDQLIYAAVVGFLMCILMHKTGTILAPMLVHFIMNTIGAVQSLFMADFDPNTLAEMESMTDQLTYLTEHIGAFAAIMISGMVVMGLTGTGIILLIIEQKDHKQLFHFKDEADAMPLKEKLRLCLTAPGMLVCCIVLTVLTVLRAMGIF